MDFEKYSQKTQLIILISCWILISILFFLANKIWNFNESLTLIEAFITGMVLMYMIFLIYSVIIDFFESKHKFKYIVFAIIAILLIIVMELLYEEKLPIAEKILKFWRNNKPL